MALPDATLSIQDGQLGALPAAVANASVKMGICSDGLVNTLYPLSDTAGAQAALGQGPLMEAAADTLAVAGGPVYALPLNPTTQGTVAAVTHVGPGAGAIGISRANAKTIDIKITTGGTLGTAAFQFRLNGGAYSAPITTTGGSFSFLVPGTNTVLTFAAATYTLNDVYTQLTTGGITVVGTGPAGNITQASSPLDVYNVLITITTTGAAGVGVWTYSLDGGNSTSSQILVPSTAYAIPNTGLVISFSGTFTAGDTYSSTSTTALFTNSDVTAGFTALFASPLEWGFVHLVGMGTNAAAAASLAATVDAQTTIAETAFRYVRAIIECPTTESDSTVATAFASFVSNRVGVSAGDIGHTSVVSGRILRRNGATVYTSRLAGIRPAEHPGYVGRGPLKNVKSLYRDETKTPLLDASRFVTYRTIVGLAGYFVTRGNMMAAGGSDFSSIMNCRVMDMSCRIARSATLLYLNKDLLVDKKTGGIYEPEAVAIESFVDAQLTAGVVNTDNATDATVVVSRAEQILITKRLPMQVRVLPKGYSEAIAINIGFNNPALQLA